jgi:hypothetical protein
MHGEKYDKCLKTVSLNNITSIHCTESVSEDIKEQLLIMFKCRSKFAFQMYKTTDVAGLAWLLVFFTVLKKTFRKILCSAYHF